jgi:hypothetical protein
MLGMNLNAGKRKLLSRILIKKLRLKGKKFVFKDGVLFSVKTGLAMATTKGSEAAHKAWETRRRRAATGKSEKTPAEKAWDTRRKNEAIEEQANIDAIKILDDLAAERESGANSETS